jgi:prolyl 4-hydroxylase
MLIFLLLLLLIIIPNTKASSCNNNNDATSFPIQISSIPRIFIYDDVFTEQQAHQLRKKAEPHLDTAGTMNFQGQIHDKNKARDASVAGVHPTNTNDNNDIVQIFRNLMATSALSPEENGEILQVTKYGQNQKYEIHFDSSMVAGRIITVLAFLSVPKQGGELVFPWAQRNEFINVNPPGISGQGRSLHELRGVHKEPAIGLLCTNSSHSLVIRPKIGRIVVWFNHDPMLRREGYSAMHGGCPVKSNDEKWIAQMWIKWHIPLYEPNILAKSFKKIGVDWKLAETS